MSKSKMGDAFKAQLGRVPLSDHARRKLGKELGDLQYKADAIKIRLHQDEYACTAQAWFFYGWQACEKARKP